MRSHSKAATAGSNRHRADKLALPVVLFAALLVLVVVTSAVAASPIVTTNAATNNTGTKATFNGTVNPEGEELTECKFEWGTTGSFGQTVPCAESLASIGAGTSPVAVHADLSNLQPNGQQYVFRLVATNPSGTVNGSNEVFITPDTVVTTAASAVTTSSATLNGTVNPDGIAITECLFEWGETTSYGDTAPCVPNAAGIGSGTSPVAVSANISGLDLGTPYHYRLKAANANGPIFGDDMTVQTLGPRVAASWSQGVAFTEAVLRAEIDPEGLPTTYRFEYGTTGAYGSETPELSVGSDSSMHVVSRFLEGLQPGTTYHYRVVAANADATNTGPDRTLTTFEHFVPQTDCPNQEFRTGLSAQLPDCRAYEMVSPVDKAGADIVPWVTSTFDNVGSEQAALDGEKIAYASAKPFGDAAGNFLAGTQYIASRGAGGWSSHAITPLHENNVFPFASIGQVPARYSAFTEDLSTGFLYDDAKPPLTPDALTGYFNNYLWHSETESFEALTTQVFSPGVPYLGGMGFQGYSDNAEHTIFVAEAQLTPDAIPGEFRQQLYDYHDGELELVSVLPNDEPAWPASAGSGGGGNDPNTEHGETRNAISDDGSHIFWMELSFGNTGRLYARIDGETTIPISGSVSADPNATYWAASNDGSEVIFGLVGGDGFAVSADEKLYRFDVDTQTPTLIASEVHPETGVLGASEDASHVYFLSEEALAPGATAGEPNLYLDEEGAKTFIGTLAQGDQTGGGIGGATANNTRVPNDFSQVTPDGRHVVFNSRASLTGYDNTSLETGTPAVEVFSYDADANELTCVSCNPSGARPQTDALVMPHIYGEHYGEDAGVGFQTFNFQAAAWLPTPRRGTYTPRMVADDGSRIFFNALDSLVPQDSNGAQDVYQWVEQGIDGCEETDGCVSLISSGTNPKPSSFIDASEDSADVFFRTEASIYPTDPGLIDIYNARVGGGLPVASTAPPCVGDACQDVPEPPNDPTPASAGFRGAGDPAPTKPRRSCRARGRKAKQSAKAQSKKAKRCKRNNRRAGR